MNTTTNRPLKGDPSEIIQVFPKYEIQIHCCRYWWLQNWEFNDLSFPFWRVYHNSFEGAAIIYNNQKIPITPDKLILIAPNTSYSTYMYNNSIPQSGYSLKGGRVSQMLPYNEQYLLHLFIHFNLGMPYDNAIPGVYALPINKELDAMLAGIKKHLNYEHAKFSFYSTLAINTIINHLLSSLPEESWQNTSADYRIIDVIKHIENNLTNDLSNPQLARIASMATNAFTRLFTREAGISPQKYVKKKRIDKACILLHHSTLSIEEIATTCGFADRYHFTRIFNQLTGYSPAKYKKEFRINS
ncbi:helix-turn-helix transcriptional regulator [Carboxylicivirga mesophila]|uniref:Helix-turn-helix transcriptional regulator n=1 Tax=Carboxylicivirga mesophila TaxID=1166478 RepID=A0ABS5KFI0_9BACT|nr:AraC family transcriptional regulator [Carboxylicivirga mesophila]MBS2213664.1 helix-turn-helix transcriptional regulator [Carboxylicivirga mesophila]